MNKPRGVILVRMDPPRDREVDWNEWYNKEHLASRIELPGFLAARRYEIASGLPEKFIVAGPKYLTIIEIENIDVITLPSLIKLRQKEADSSATSFDYVNNHLPNRSGGVFEQIFPDSSDYEIPDDAAFLLAVGHSELPSEIIDEYNAWYNTEHIPSYVEIPGFINARRFQAIQEKSGALPGSTIPGPQFIALYDLVNDKVFKTEEFKQRSSTPWSTRIRSWTWERRKMNNIYRCIYTAKRR